MLTEVEGFLVPVIVLVNEDDDDDELGEHPGRIAPFIDPPALVLPRPTCLRISQHNRTIGPSLPCRLKYSVNSI